MADAHAPVDAAVDELRERDAVGRMWSGDHTLWQPDPDEIANRLGWLTEPVRVASEVPALVELAARVRADGFRHVLWCGMGGSSLFPLVLAEAIGPAEHGLTLEVLDTSHPGPVLRALDGDLEHTLLCFASKSGGTIETRAQLDVFWDRVGRPEQFVVVTDEGSALDVLARERGFRATFCANPDIGGRYSALSLFGLVPAALLGLDVDELLLGAQRVLRDCRSDDPAENPGAVLAAFIGGHARTGRDKCTLLTPPVLGPFGAWLEQLVAESTGKHGVGILPVEGEPLGAVEVYGRDRAFVAYDDAVPAATLRPLRDAGHAVAVLEHLDGTEGSTLVTRIGAEVARWEVAVALAGALLGINPFDQPDVEAAKQAATSALHGAAPPVAVVEPSRVLDSVAAGDYVAIQAFVDPADPVLDRLGAVRRALRDRLRVATTIGIGPRYLHSTGQLHKGGAPNGVFLQVVDPDPPELAVPGRDYSLERLLCAQADGDHAALSARGRRVARVALADLLALA